jgi:hypothetical protein
MSNRTEQKAGAFLAMSQPDAEDRNPVISERLLKASGLPNSSGVALRSRRDRTRWA